MNTLKISDPECLTCKKFDNLEKCEFSRAKISPNFKHFLMECLGPDIPYTILVSLTSEQVVHVLEENNETKGKVEETRMPSIQYKAGIYIYHYIPT